MVLPRAQRAGGCPRICVSHAHSGLTSTPSVLNQDGRARGKFQDGGGVVGWGTCQHPRDPRDHQAGPGEEREREWASADIKVPVIPLHGARCVATAYVCTSMGIPSAMTSGSMPTPLTFTPLAGLRRLGTSCSPPKVRPSRAGHSEAVSPSDPSILPRGPPFPVPVPPWPLLIASWCY